jgi:hypothetical protein
MKPTTGGEGKSHDNGSAKTIKTLTSRGNGPMTADHRLKLIRSAVERRREAAPRLGSNTGERLLREIHLSH